MIAPSRFLLGLLLAAGLSVSACSSDHTGPAEPADPAIPDMAGEGIPLTIDVATGAVSVGSLPSGDDGLSHSLLGSDVIDLHAGNCSFSPVPRNNKLTRCSFELSLKVLSAVLEKYDAASEARYFSSSSSRRRVSPSLV